MYVYELGVIEKHGTGDTNDVFVCEHRGDMNRLAARMNELTAENAKLRAELAEAKRKLADALDALVNVYDLCNLPPIWDGNVAAVLAMNGILSDGKNEQ